MIDLGNIIRYLVQYGYKYSDDDIYKYICQKTFPNGIKEEFDFFVDCLLSRKATFESFCKEEYIESWGGKELAKEYLMSLKQMLEYMGNYGNSSNSKRKFLRKEDFNDAIFLKNEVERLQECDTERRLQGYKRLKTIYNTLKDFELYAHIEYEEDEKAKNVVVAIDLWEEEVEPFMRIYGNTNEDEEEAQDKRNEGEYVLQLPNELNTEKAQRVFNKAIGKGWVRANNDGFEWVGIDGRRVKAQLGYLCAEIYGYKNTRKMGNEGENIPYEALQKLFNVLRLDRTIQQVYEAKKPQLWRRQIDEIIE